MHVIADHAAPHWVDALHRAGFRPAKDARAQALPGIAVDRHTAFLEAAWCHCHYLKSAAPPYMLIELCCHGCAEGLKVAFRPVPHVAPPWPALALVRDAWSHGHHACGPKWQKRMGWYRKGLQSLCVEHRAATWMLRIDDVMSNNRFAPAAAANGGL